MSVFFFVFFYQELDGLQSGLKKKAESSFDCDAKLIGLQVSLSVLQVNSGSFKLLCTPSDLLFLLICRKK